MFDGQSSLESETPLTALRWRPGAHPLHRNEPHKNQFGLGMDFATTYAAGLPGVEVGLIPCAWGGQPIERLGVGSPLYANTLTRARAAVTTGSEMLPRHHSLVGVPPHHSLSGVLWHHSLIGVLWHQGESDTESVAAATAHAAALRHLIDDLRFQLEVADLAFLIGDLAPTFGVDAGPERAEAIAVLRTSMASLVAEDVRCGWVSSDRLETAADRTHFTRDALREFGRRYAQQMLLIGTEGSPPRPAAVTPEAAS